VVAMEFASCSRPQVSGKLPLRLKKERKTTCEREGNARFARNILWG